VTDRTIRDEHVGTDGVTFAPEFGGLLDRADAVLVSPGIPDSNELLVVARHRQLPVTNATQIFFRRCPCPVVGVTGSSGKSTTASLIAAILRAAGRSVALGGNIGNPMLDLLPGLTPDSIAVVELSSFQLQLVDASPHAAVITNLSPNHLDRHGSMKAYVTAKSNILAHQDPSDVAVLNAADPLVRELAGDTAGRVLWFAKEGFGGSGAFLKSDTITLQSEESSEPVIERSEIPVPGSHNVQNILAAAAVTSALGARPAAMREAITQFRGLPHRLQFIARRNGVTYVDDSIATSPERTAVGIAAIETPVILIAGGRSKHLPWAPVLRAGRNKLRLVVLVGEASDELEDALDTSPERPATHRAQSLSEAVRLADRNASSGDTVLLSPGCTSFDMFQDFEERGQAFISAVEALDGTGG